MQTAHGGQLTTEPTRIGNLSLILPHITMHVTVGDGYDLQI